MGVVAVVQAGEGVGDLVEQHIADGGLVVEADEVVRQPDRAGNPSVGIFADLYGTESSLAASPGEAPAVGEEAVGFHQVVGELLGVGVLHGGSVILRSGFGKGEFWIKRQDAKNAKLRSTPREEH